MSKRTSAIVSLASCAGVIIAASATCACVPSVCVPLIPLVCVLAYYLGTRLGWWFPLCPAALVLAIGLPLHGACLFVAGGATITACICLPLALRKKLSGVAQIGVAAALGLAVAMAVLGLFGAGLDMRADEVIPREYRVCDDALTDSMASRYYEQAQEQDLLNPRLDKSDPNYMSEARAEYSAYIGRILDGELLWYVTGFGAFACGIGVLGGLAVASVRGESTVRVRDLRLGRLYLIVIAAALLFSVLGLFDTLRPTTITVFNLFITLPTAMCGITVLYHSLARPPGKARIATEIIFWLCMTAAAIFYEWGMLILGFIGLADIIIDIRRALDWALRG